MMDTKPSDTSVKVSPTVNEPAVNRFHSTTWETLSREYPKLGNIANFLPVAIFIKYISLTKDALIGNAATPRPVLKFYNASIDIANKADNLFCLLVITEGLDVLIKRYDTNSNTSPLWILLAFFIDYLANILNHLLRLVMSICQTKKLVKPKLYAEVAAEGQQHKLEQKKPLKLRDEELPHLTELLSTTRSTLPYVSEIRDTFIRDTFQRDYVTLIRDKANGVIEPRKEQAYKLVKPAYYSAMDTVRSVTTCYETNLNKENSSIPKALYSTGLDLGTRTVHSWGSTLFPTKTK